MRVFRKATAADANALSHLYEQLVPGAPIQVLPDQIAKVANDENTYLILCEDDNDIIATALVTLCNDVMFNEQPFAVIENLVVSEDYRREGIGKSLMDHIEAFCLQRDCSKIMLLSGADNRSGHDFYAAMGYDPDAKLGFIKKRRDFNC